MSEDLKIDQERLNQWKENTLPVESSYKIRPRLSKRKLGKQKIPTFIHMMHEECFIAEHPNETGHN